MEKSLLTIILFAPSVAALLTLLIPKEYKKFIRIWALVASLVPLVFALVTWFGFEGAAADVNGYKFVVNEPWYQAIGSSYHLGMDGLSLTMVLLTTLLTPLAILASFSIEDRPRMYMALFLFLETGMLGVFLSLDLLLFFVFWEIGLVPMYFLINQWGSPKGEKVLWNGMKVANRTYASFKFMIYTMAGSLGLLLAIQMLGVVFQTFDLPYIVSQWNALASDHVILGGFTTVGTAKAVAFWAFTIAFALKVPVWPFHTWLPDAHTEAPTAGSMILAGVLLKLGAFGFLRFVLPLYPEQAKAAPISWPGWLRRRSSSAHLLPSDNEISNAWWRILLSTTWALCCWGLPQPPGQSGPSRPPLPSTAPCCKCSIMASPPPGCSSWSA